ncbi:MAG: CoA-acylating methylmalonate-semialdehyde dehydrogenase [Clostridia bacterium]|nr:CoA-acylating methylmalonate-semialdehyde dehydrogenase [Clostridia bacterium]
MKTLKYFFENQSCESKTDKFYEVYNPSTGEHVANMPRLTLDEVKTVIKSSKQSYSSWSDAPITKRVQILYKVKQLLEENLDELTHLVAFEHGKSWSEAKGDVLKAIEGTEHAISAPALMMGESLMNISKGYDTVTYREPLGVFVGICPFNFPAMIPMGWMVPMCLVTGNTMIVKASGATPMSALRIAELYKQAGLPSGVLSVISCDREVTNELLVNDDIAGISFVGSTAVGSYIYKTAAAAGKRVQALCEAKNHALVLEDAALERSAAGIINAAFGCAGERCMALPVIVAQESIADKLVALLKGQAEKLVIGAAYDKNSQLGPVYSASHKKSVENWIQKGIDEGAKVVLDGRGYINPENPNGFYLAPTIFDYVTPEMTIGTEEVFGPVLCVKRVKDFEEGIKLMNASPFANGSVIYTQNGYYSREFVKRTDGGMVGINVGIPVPVGFFSFTGHKKSFFGDLHILGKDGMRFFTETKTVTSHWFDEEEKKQTKVTTWDGTINEK